MCNNVEDGSPKMELSVVLAKGANDVQTLFSFSEPGSCLWETAVVPLTGLLPRGYLLDIRATRLLLSLTPAQLPQIAIAAPTMRTCAKSYSPPDCDFEKDQCTFLNALNLKPAPATVFVFHHITSIFKCKYVHIISDIKPIYFCFDCILL